MWGCSNITHWWCCCIIWVSRLILLRKQEARHIHLFAVPGRNEAVASHLRRRYFFIFSCETKIILSLVFRDSYIALVALMSHGYIRNTLPGVLLGVLDELRDTLADLPGDNPPKADAFDELAFLCHLAMGAFVIGISSFRILWMSFSNPNWAIIVQLFRQPDQLQ